MTLDRFCQLFVLSLLPILFLPKGWLVLGVGLGGIWLLLAVILRFYSLLILAVLVMFSYGQVIQIAKNADEITASRGQSLIHIEQIVKQQADYQTAIATDSSGSRLFVNWQAKTPLKLAERYQATLIRRPISSRLNQGNLDKQKWYFSQGIEQLATVKQAEIIIPTSPHFKGKIGRNGWFERVFHQTENLPSQGLLLALAFGERGWLSQADWQHFQQTSTAHLIAISGLHIALAFGVGALCGKGIHWLYWQIFPKQAVRFSPFFTQWNGLIFAIGYSYLAGFAVPTLRALLAICLILGLKLIRRYYTPWQYWWRTVALLLLFDPVSLLSDSFWLSILAVASLILWYQCFPLKAFLPEKCKKWGRTVRLFIGLLHLQIGIWLLFLPVQFYFFEGLSPFSLIANMLIVPLYSLLLVPLILFSLLTDNLFSTWQLADWLAQGSLRLLSPLSHHWLILSCVEQWQLFSVNFLILTALIVYQQRVKKQGLQKQGSQKKQKKMWGRLIVFPLFILQWVAFATWFLPAIFTPTPIQWINFDVGQGLAMALVYQQKGERKAILYDTGASWQGGSMAEIEIIPYLQRHGIGVEAIFVSHSDNDHSGGVPALLTAYPNARLILSQPSGFGHSAVEPCVAGQQWQFGEIALTAISPKKLVKRAKNGDSCVLLVEIGRYRLLFTGDSGASEEREFAHRVGKIDFLQVGHHGSNSSSSHTLLANTQPDVAIISAGRWNPWKLPTKQIEKRLDQYHILQFNTAKEAMIWVDFYPDYYQIHRQRERFSPWYHAYFGKP